MMCPLGGARHRELGRLRETAAYPRRLKFDPAFRLNSDPGMEACGRAENRG